MNPHSGSFFKEKQLAAFLKHGILSRYLEPFATKTGVAPPHRVMLVDGYAGEGQYADETPASPLLLLEVAKRLNGRNRLVECVFVEKVEKTYNTLTALLAEKAPPGAVYHALHGEFLQQLGAVCKLVEGRPTLFFIDPFGRMFPFDDFVDRVLKRTGYRASATEAIINFSLKSVWRVGGRFAKGQLSDNAIDRLNGVFGGDWWQAHFKSNLPASQIAQVIGEEYMTRVCNAAGYSGWSVKVHPKVGNAPIYLLQAFTRHPDGMVLFGQAASGAAEALRREIAVQAEAAAVAAGEFPGLALSIADNEEAALQALYVNRVRENVRAVLDVTTEFYPERRYDEVFEGVLGEARGTHLTQACAQLAADGIIERATKLLRGGVIRRGPNWAPLKPATPK